MPLRTLLAAFLLVLGASSLPAQVDAPTAHQDWLESSRAELGDEGARLQARLSTLLEALRTQVADWEDALGAADADSLATPAGAFAFLRRELGDEPAALGLPLGAQLLLDGEPLAWTGFAVPLGAEAGDAPLTPGAGTQFSLRSFGVHHFLSLRGRQVLLGRAQGGVLEWIWDLPLAHRLPRNRGGLPVLLDARPHQTLRLLPILRTPREPDEPAGEPWRSEWREIAARDAQGLDGPSRAWRLAVAGGPLCELQLWGEDEAGFRVRRRGLQRRGLGVSLFALVLTAGLLLRARLRRGRPAGLPLAARAPFIVGWVLLLRGILRWAELPAALLPGPFWSSGSFALDLPGGFFDSPGEFLISALAALLILVLLLRPYLHPEDGDEEDAAPPPAMGASPPRLLLALFAPLLAVLGAGGFALLVFRNGAPELLLDARLLAADAIGFNVALFLACVFLVSLFLVPAHFAWRRLPRRRWPRLAASLPLVALAWLLTGPPGALALMLLLPVAWGFRRAASRFTGLLFHVVFVILAVTLLVEGARDRAAGGLAAQLAVDRAREAAREQSYWQPQLVERTLLELGREPGLRRQLAREEGADEWLALAAWQQSGLDELGERACVEIYDARGRLRSRYQRGLDLPAPVGHGAARAGRPDLSLVVETTLSAVGADSLRVVTGEMSLSDNERRPLGFLVLRILDSRDAERADAVPAPAGFPRWLLAASQRLFLHLLVLGALLLLDLVFSRFRVVRRYLPPLLGPRGLGFQHRLLGAFLLVALLPVVLTGLIAGRQIRAQQDAASRQASLERALSARRSLENRVRQDARDLAASEYVRNFVAPDFPPTVRDIGSLEHNRIMIFDAGGDLLLDESLRNWSPAQVDSFLGVLPPGRVVYEREGRRVYAGLLMPMEIWHRDARLGFSVYYRLHLDSELLDDLRAVVGGELNLYGSGSLLHAGRPELFGLGYQPPMLDAATQAALGLGGAERYQNVEHVGDFRFGRSTLPLADALGRPVALLSSLESAGRAGGGLGSGTSLVFSMIALLLVLALGLGAFLAGRVFLPIRRLQLGTRRLSAGDFDYRLPDAGRDEIGELMSGFNSMAAGLQATREALEERRRFLESLLANVASGVLAFDEAGCLRSLNPAARRLLALGDADLEGLSLEALSSLDRPGAAALFRHLAAHPEGLRGPDCELRLADAEGARSLRLADADTGGGRVLVFEDVTELIRSQKLAAWSEMARQIAHEIKNPLTPIKLSAQFIGRAWRDRRDDFDTILDESLGSIDEQVEILRRIAAEFSQFGRRSELNLETVDLGGLLAEVLAPYRGETLTVDWSGPESLHVTADREALRKVLLNLVENARQAMEGEGALSVALRESDGRALLRLRDRGPGIPPEALDRLFEPYFSTKTSGTGLGLAISAQLVDEMGGALALDNHGEGGAVASLSLPRA